ncbi:MAG: DUF4062 domain-containing protein [Clostridium sp.]|nr:DUF4062 domain-containing protein [Clostridium sp.]
MSKLQVFISSTYKDLREVRMNIIHTILHIGHIPLGMEFFEQDDRGQMPVIKEFIDACDVFLILIGNQYGTICKETGKSYTQMEYEYACERNKKMIKIILKGNDDEPCDNPERLESFINLVRGNQLIPAIDNEVTLGADLTRILTDYENECERLDGITNEIFKHKYELMQYLFFNNDRREGFNRFNVLPKMLMLMDMEQCSNPVRIERLDILYSITKNEKNDEFVYDGKREWHLSTIRNISNDVIDKFYFYTATDIGNRHDSTLKLMDCANGTEFSISDDAHKNNEISRWQWNIEPIVPAGRAFNDMGLSETMDGAWDFRFHRNERTNRNEHKQEIINFIPKNFGMEIGFLQFDICVDISIPILDLSLYEIRTSEAGVIRNCKGRFVMIGNDGVQRNYRLRWDNQNEEINMNAVYYVALNMID